MEKITFDAADLRILAALQHDASVSNQDLAASVHVSPATCLRRVKRLRELGVIERQIAVLSPAKLGFGLTVIAEVSLDRQNADDWRAFELCAVADAAVQQCYRVAPGPDFVLIVQVVDMPAYGQVVERLFSRDANVRNVRSFFVTSRAKFAPGVILPSLTSGM